MDEGLLKLLSIILIIAGMAGTFLPVLPGLALSFAGFLVYFFGVENNLPDIYVWIFAIFTVSAMLLDYIIPAKTTKKYGGTRWGSIGSVIGTIIGIFFIPLPFGFLIGMFAGVYIGELLHDSKDRRKALNSVKGAFFGFLYGTGLSLVIAFAMFLVVILDIIKYL